MLRRDIRALGEPALQIGRLRLWVHGRQFPDSNDYWDGNWLSVTAYYQRHESSVVATGPILHLGELWGLHQGCLRMHDSSAGQATLECLEPNLAVQLQAGATGRVTVETAITPDHLTETHKFRDELDLSYLPGIISACDRIFQDYPIKEPSQLARGDA